MSKVQVSGVLDQQHAVMLLDTLNRAANMAIEHCFGSHTLIVPEAENSESCRKHSIPTGHLEAALSESRVAPTGERTRRGWQFENSGQNCVI